ncbi:unnamed protein product [Rotaria sordida]|uniref:Rhamnogalacturonase A/B/Epimerase-like pectate lyase domain-containing protein n=1 Tax=Rotaria sordida TaxID=392033 RepID=A0A814M5R9_9BILA|nr:unnamed protein product [Rotaria sordida]CAF1539922.1 unnamed protein product [Rotaria sordida]
MKSASYWFIAIMVLIQWSHIDGIMFSVSMYGAFPNDNIDDTFAVQSAINNAIANGPNNIVVFQSGTYNFTSPISIYNAVNLTVMGQGMQQTLLVGNSPVAMLKPLNCRGVTITSLTIDFDPLPFTAGYVVNVSTSYLDVQVVPPHRADIDRQVRAILRYNPVMMRPASGSNTYEIYQTPPSNVYTSLVSNGILRIPLASPTKFVIGDPIVARYYSIKNAIDAQDITDFNIQSITIYTAWAVGIMTLRIKGMNIIDYHVIPRTGRWMSTSVDCMHIGDSRDYINIVNSKCEAQGDDGLNVHAFYFTVTEIINSTALVIKEFNFPDVLNVGVGTRLEFSRSQQQFTVYTTAIVAFSYINGPNTRVFVFTSPINVSVGDWASVADAPALTIRNFTVANNRARGVLVKTRNVHITHSLFNGTSGPAVLFEPSLYWHESVAAHNVTLGQNIYINCNEGIAKEKGVISFAPNPRQSIPIFTDIVIESSTFLFGSYSEGLIQGNNADADRNFFLSDLHTLYTNCKHVLNYTAEHNEFRDYNLPSIGPLMICGVVRAEKRTVYRQVAHHAQFPVEEDQHILRQAGYLPLFACISPDEDSNTESWIRNEMNKDYIYDYHEIFLRMLNSVDMPKSHWLLKSPFHILYLDKIVRQYPNALLIMIHRRLDEVLPSSDEFETAMRNWLLENPQGKQGRHMYSSDEFGLSREDIQTRYADYINLFLSSTSSNNQPSSVN